jgi:hypothetical protein
MSYVVPAAIVTVVIGDGAQSANNEIVIPSACPIKILESFMASRPSERMTDGHPASPLARMLMSEHVESEAVRSS